MISSATDSTSWTRVIPKSWLKRRTQCDNAETWSDKFLRGVKEASYVGAEGFRERDNLVVEPWSRDSNERRSFCKTTRSAEWLGTSPAVRAEIDASAALLVSTTKFKAAIAVEGVNERWLELKSGY
jgi:hypothetical protein